MIQFSKVNVFQIENTTLKKSLFRNFIIQIFR